MFIDKFRLLQEIDKCPTIVRYHSIHSDKATEFYNCYIKLRHILKEMDDDNLKEYFKSLTLIFNFMRSSRNGFFEELNKVNFSDVTLLFERLEELDETKEMADFVGCFHAILLDFKNGNVENKFPESILQLSDGHPRVGVVNYRWSTLEVIDDMNSIKYMTLTEYQNTNEYFDLIIFSGTPSYYQIHYPLITAIRKSREIIYLYYDFYKAQLVRSKAISYNEKKYSRIYDGITEEQCNIIKLDEKGKGQESDEHIVVNSAILVKKWLDRAKQASAFSQSLTPATLYSLESGKILFLPIDSRVRIVSPDTLDIKQKNKSKIQSGEWIVIKESSERDFIRNQASTIYGTNYERDLKRATEYKEKLKEILQTNKAYEKTISDLAKFGINSDRQLLKNWAFGETITPRCYDKLLIYFGENEEKIQSLLEITSALKRAHIQAGRELSKNISNILSAYGKDEIKNDINLSMYSQFTLVDVGTFTVEVIKEVHENIVEIHNKDLYKLIDEIENV